jgi:hypothetical protein
MRVRDLQVLTYLNGLAVIALVALCWWIGHLSYPDLARRPVVSWQPSLSANASTESNARSLITTIETIRRPIFRVSRTAFDPSTLQQAAAIIVQSQLPPAPELPLPTPQPIAEPVPAIVAAATPQPQPDVTPQFVLKGLAIINGKKSALIVEPSKPEGIWLSVDEALIGWKLLSVDSNQAKLIHELRTITLLLYVDNSTKLVGSSANSP